MEIEEISLILNKHYKSCEKIILSRQDPITGLLPASTAITAHGDYTDAWVRDNVYSILSVWGLSQAYKKYFPTHNRTYTLSQSVVKLMRGLLNSMMMQSKKVEKFKYSLDVKDSLHAKYSTSTGQSVVGDDEWGHLQLDATSIYLLMLAQMIASGLKIVFNLDEVNFIQNLVHYISKTYCTPDFGIWERGHKFNKGNAEVNCSSVGMAKAALESLNGFNLFGNVSSNEGVIHVIPSDIARSRLTLEGLLPRESISKEVDAALLSIIGYPAYAVENSELVKKTKDKIVSKLEGRYGCKRFLLDGHQTVLEDSNRLYYEANELKKFENIECEWPLFFTYLLLNSIMSNDTNSISYWSKKLEKVFINIDGENLIPELYLVPEDKIEKEKENPKSQGRVANENVPLVWAQSLYMLSSMMMDKVLSPNDIDPLNRRNTIGKKKQTNPMVTIIAQNDEVKDKLLSYGFSSQTIEEVEPIKIMHAQSLSKVHNKLGQNSKLALSGRPPWIPRSITTARLHILNNEKVLFLSYYFNPKGFYFAYDNVLLVENFISSLKFLSKHWNEPGQAIMPFLVREDMLEGEVKDVILNFLRDLKYSQNDLENIKTAPLEQLLATASVEKIDELHDFEFEDLTSNEQNKDLNIEYFEATKNHDWKKVRQLAQELSLVAYRIEDSLLETVIRQKRLAVGRSYTKDAIFTSPTDASTIVSKIDKYCGDNKAEKALTQEIILHLVQILRTEPKLFENILTLRTWYFVQLLVSMVSRNEKLPLAEAYEKLLSFSPYKIYESLLKILRAFSKEVNLMIQEENLQVNSLDKIFISNEQETSLEGNTKNWLEFRKEQGFLIRVNDKFYKNIWYMLQKCKGLVIGDKYNLNNRIDKEFTFGTTAGEKSFDLKLESLLQGIGASEYRQLNIEALETLSWFFKENPKVEIEDDLILDVIIGHSVRFAWESKQEVKNYEEEKAQAWSYMYNLNPKFTKEIFIKTFVKLLEEKA